jgi:hypothetical protein
MVAHRPSSPSPDSLSAHALGPRLILTTFVGRSTLKLSESACARFEALIAEMEQPVWISDASRLTGFEPRSLAMGPRWFAAFRERGGKDCLVVSQWNIAIMAASTMALGLGVRIRNFATLQDARSAAAKLIDTP